MVRKLGQVPMSSFPNFLLVYTHFITFDGFISIHSGNTDEDAWSSIQQNALPADLTLNVLLFSSSWKAVSKYS